MYTLHSKVGSISLRTCIHYRDSIITAMSEQLCVCVCMCTHEMQRKCINGNECVEHRHIYSTCKCCTCTHVHKHITVLSQVSAHGCSQLRCQNLRVGGCVEEMVECFNYTVEFLVHRINSYTPLFWQKMLIFVLKFIRTRKNEIIILLFVQQKRKQNEIAFLTSRSVSKHVPFALGVNSTARDAGEGGGSNLVSQATPFAVSYESSSRLCSLTTQVQYRQALQDVKQML